MMVKHVRHAASLLMCLSLASPLWAQAYHPTLSELLGVDEVTRNWIPEATSVLNRYYEEDGGVNYDMTWDSTGEGFSRLVMQRRHLGSDWTAYDSVEFVVEAITGHVDFKPFLSTGEWEFTEPIWDPIHIPEGTETVISVDFDDLTNPPILNDVRQLGFQAFGPASGNGLFRISPVDPVSLSETQLFSFEDDFEGWTSSNWSTPDIIYDLATDKGVTDGNFSLMYETPVPGFCFLSEVTISEDSHPEAYEALTSAIVNGGGAEVRRQGRVRRGRIDSPLELTGSTYLG